MRLLSERAKNKKQHMKNFILLLCGIFLAATISAQTLQNGIPVILSNAGDCGEQFFPVGSDGTSFNLTSRDDALLYSSLITSSSDNYSVNSVNILPAGSGFSVRYLDDSPTFHTTAATGTAPNRNVTLQGLSANGDTEYLQTYTTSADDFGLKTIGARSPIGGTLTDGAFTVAARAGADDLYQLVVLRTDESGDIAWETVIPMEQTGYDIIFQGQVDGEFVYETQPIPVVSIVEEVPDGYIIVNQNKLYSPPTTSEQYANIIKIDFAGNVLWNSNIRLPWRELEVGSNSSADLGFRGRVTSVEGTQNGNTYFTFSSSGDINPNAQYRQLDNTGAVIESFSTSWIVNDNFSWFIKEIDGEVYWVKLSETFIDDGPPTNVFDFAIFNITNGITNVDAAINPVAFIPATPGETFIPKDLEQLANGDFIVTGAYYSDIAFPDFFFDPTDGETFIIRLENQEQSGAGADLNLSVSASDENTGIYENVEIIYTVTNEGSTAATGVTAKISRTSASVLAGSTPAIASQGSLELGYTDEALWQIGDLAPGQTETLTLTYFTLASNTSFFGEISEMNEADNDSTPDNGIFGDAQEDDEAGIEIGPQNFIITGQVFLDEMRQGGIDAEVTDMFLSGIELQLFIQGTDDLVATATTNTNGFYIFPNISSASNYSLRYAVQNDLVHFGYFIPGTNFDVTSNFVTADDGFGARIGILGNDGPEVIKNLALTDGSQCTLEELYVETICDDGGTPDNPNDDIFALNFRADGLGLGGYTISDAGGTLFSSSVVYSNGFVTSPYFFSNSLPLTLTVNNLGTLPNVPCSLSENISSSGCVDVGNNLPDFTFISLDGNVPLIAQVGQQAVQSPNIRATNIGQVDTPAGQFIPAAAYLSTDDSVSNDDIEVDYNLFQALPVGFQNPVGGINIPENIAPGVYQLIRVIDVTNNIAETNENNNIFITQITINSNTGGGEVDLELTASNETPTIYQNGQAVFTITNNGTQTATGIRVAFNKNSTVNITGTPITTLGASALHWTDTPSWNVGNLSAGQSATITYDIFSLSNNINFYGQVTAQNENDADSTPNNGNGTSANEDDEVSYPGGGIVIEEGLQVNCNTTTNPPTPIFVNPDININAAEVYWDIPTATTDCPGGIVNVEQLNGPTQGGFLPPITNGYDVVYQFTDECGNSELCVISFQVLGFAGELVCPDDITVTATSSAGAIVTFADAVPFTGCNADPTGPFEGEPMSGDLFPIGTTEIRFAEFFSGSPAYCQTLENCYMNITVLPEGGGENGVDLELTASSDAPTIYQNGTATFTITNNGNETATGIELEFHKNNTLNITATPVVSQGTSQVHWTEVPRWNVGNLAAGQSATINYDIFSLSNNINFYGQVTAQNETDADSTPNNGDGITPTEDDEVSYPGGEIVVPCQLTITQIEYACDDQGTSTPSDDTWIQTYVIDNNNSDATGYNIYPGGGSGTYPATLSFGGLVAAAGMNTNMFLVRDIDNFECSGSISVFPPAGCGEDPVEDLPDLTLDNLNANSGAAGEISEYTVEVSNIGTANVSGSYVIGAYLSTDNQLDAGDTQVGVINTGNTPVGTEPLTTGSITVPSGQTPGNYFLILETDTNGNIAESNDNNNIVSVPFVVLSGDNTCNLNVELQAINCQQFTNAVTGAENDSYRFWLFASGEESDTGWHPYDELDTPAAAFSFDEAVRFSGLISEGPQTVTIRLYDDPTCTSSITVIPPAPCPSADNCRLGVTTENMTCTGDTYSFDIYGAGVAGAFIDYIVTLPAADGNGTYTVVGQPGFTTPVTYSVTEVVSNLGGVIDYTVHRVDNPDCIVSGTLFLPGNCAPNTGSDLSLDISAPATIGQYQNFTAEFTVTNNGTQTATNVSAEILAAFDNLGIIFQGGNEASVSQGLFDGEYDTVWSIGTIPAGGTATLTANLFSLASSSNTLWGEILSHNQTDSDSTPANGTYGQSNEDDEAVFTVNVTSNFQSGSTTNAVMQNGELSANLYPIPTRENLSIDVFTQNAFETQLFIRDTHGKVLTTRNLATQKGKQTVQIAIDNWSNGIYFLQLFSGEEMKTYRFVKQ